MAGASGAMSQVLGGANTFGYNSGLGVYVGTHAMMGRTFGKYDDKTGRRNTVEPESYNPRLVNPLIGLGWWSESPSDNFVFGYQIMGNYGDERYTVGLGTETLTNRRKTVGLDISCYLGWHFGGSLTAMVGVQDESRMPINEGGSLNIFSSQNTIGMMAMVRYSFAEDYYAVLHAGYGLFTLGNMMSDWERYKSIGNEGYYVVDSGLKPFTLSIGVGRGL